MPRFLVRVELHEVTPAGKDNTMWATQGITLKTEDLHEAEAIHKKMAEDAYNLATIRGEIRRK